MSARDRSSSERLAGSIGNDARASTIGTQLAQAISPSTRETQRWSAAIARGSFGW